MVQAMEEAPGAQTTGEEPEEPSESLKRLPTVFTDVVSFAFWGQHIKIAFGEYVGGSEQWRSAVLMSADVAEAMINRLEEILVELRSAA